MTPDEITLGIARKLGKKGRLEYLPLDTYAGLFPGADEVTEMVQWFDQYGYYGPETPSRQRDSGRAIGGLLSFDEWLESEDFKKLAKAAME